MPRIRHVICICCAFSYTLTVAADFPAHPLRMIVPYSPSGNADIRARLVAQRLGENLGQQVVVDNRPGANGQTRAVNRAPLAGCERPRVG